MEQVINHEAFSIESFLPRKSGTHESVPSFQPHSIKRLHDGEVFCIGDHITTGEYWHGKLIQGTITHFEMLEDRVFVHHTWSGIGFSLGSIMNIAKTFRNYKIGDQVTFAIKQTYGTEPFPYTAEVKAIHSLPGNRVKYDLEIPMEDGQHTRIYNIDSCFVFPKD